jgi:threonine dehydratase
VLADFKLLIEPSSAVAVAAVIAGKSCARGQRIGLVISGGNIDLDLCPFLRGERLKAE